MSQHLPHALRRQRGYIERAVPLVLGVITLSLFASAAQVAGNPPASSPARLSEAMAEAAGSSGRAIEASAVAVLPAQPAGDAALVPVDLVDVPAASAEAISL